MIKASFIICLITLLFTSCVSSHIPNYHFNQKTSPKQLKDDVVLLKKILEANHPSLYWYTPKDSIDYYFNNAINSIQDSLTETEFRNRVAAVISKIRCGHTSVRFPVDYNKQVQKHLYPLFPLHIKTWGDSMAVIANYFTKDSIFKRGTIITAINGRTNRQILDSIFEIVGTDGYSNTYKSQVISGNFPNWYKLAWGLDSNYHISYIDSLGKPQTVIISSYTSVVPVKKMNQKHTDILKPHIKQPPVTKNSSKKKLKQAALLSKRSLLIDTAANTAYMKVATFNEGRLRTFFRRSFRTLKENSTKNLIVDLRENTGGYVTNSNLFLKYLINKPFKNADTLAAITKSIKHPYYVRESLKYWICAHLTSHKKADRRYHNRQVEQHFYQPKNNYHFDGRIYILQGGYTFSAATMVTATIKGQKNVTIVGEESGGGNYGNTAMYLPTIILPNSKLRIMMPMFRMVMDVSRKKEGRGVMPDIYINPSIEAIKKGIDFKLDAVKKLIKESEKENR